jgi:hypothetical protein
MRAPAHQCVSPVIYSQFDGIIWRWLQIGGEACLEEGGHWELWKVSCPWLFFASSLLLGHHKTFLP